MEIYIGKAVFGEFLKIDLSVSKEIVFFGATSTLILDTLERLKDKLGHKMFLDLLQGHDDLGVSPIHYASLNGHEEMIKLS